VKLVFDDITLSPFEDEACLGAKIAVRYGIVAPTEVSILKKSLDARRKRRIVYRYKILAEIPRDVAQALLKHKEVSPFNPAPKAPATIIRPSGLEVIIVGAGPAGLFCALRLIEAGATVTILERGAPVEERLHDIQALKSSGILNPESNVLFGEGGAGTYSDGKLTTRIHKPETAWFFQTMVASGAPETILYEQKPHLGTDRLVAILRRIRERISACGSKIALHTKVTDFLIEHGMARGVLTQGGEAYRAAAVVLATGHSARDMYALLSAKGITLEKKGFAVGLRIEHPRALINAIQYGPLADGKLLPSAEYALTFNHRAAGRGVYTFCMCPGGEVINASSEQDRLCINGMSYSARDSAFSNAALVVSVSPTDLPDHPLAGIEWQRCLESGAFTAGGKGFTAPAQRITSFLDDRLDTDLPISSYRPGLSAALHTYLPAWLTDELKLALRVFDSRMHGFITREGVLMGVETRTSSPVRITRDACYEAINQPGLFPVGEGAGYSGGIVSSAVDGIRAADAIVKKVHPPDA